MKVHFISFAAAGSHGKNMIKAVERIKNQAIKSNIFDFVTTYTDEDLKRDCNFWSRHEQFISTNKRGYGYMLWKPYLIGKYLNRIHENDILIYCDAGCEILLNNQTANDIKDNIINITKSQMLLANSMGKCPHTHKIMTKKDLLLYFNISDINIDDLKKYYESNRIFLFNNALMRSFVSEWYEAMCNYHLIDDSPSKEPNFEGFYEHRHDQSVLNMMLYKYNMLNQNHHFGDLKYIFQASRNRGGISTSCKPNTPFYCVCECCVP